MNRIMALAAVAVGFSSSVLYADVAENKAIVQAMEANVFEARDADAVDQYFAQDYIQYNPRLPSGAATVKRFVGMLGAEDSAPGKPNETHMIIGEGDLVATHSTFYNLGPQPLMCIALRTVKSRNIGTISPHCGQNLIRQVAPRRMVKAKSPIMIKPSITKRKWWS